MRARLVLLLLALSSPAYAWGPCVQMIGFGGTVACATPSTGSLLNEGWENASSGYEVSGWTQTKGSGAIDNYVTLPGAPPEGSCTHGLLDNALIGNTQTFTTWNAGSGIDRTKNVDIVCSIYIDPATALSANNDTVTIVEFDNNATVGAGMSWMQLRRADPNYQIRAQGATTSAAMTVLLGTWYIVTLHNDATPANSSVTVSGVGTQTFTRGDISDSQYLRIGPTTGMGVGDGIGLYVGYCYVNSTNP